MANCNQPICLALLYANATKIPCETNTERSINDSKPVVSVGECVYDELLVYSTTDIIDQMSAFLLYQCYQYGILFVGNHSYLTYVHVIMIQTGDGAVESKESFKAYA